MNKRQIGVKAGLNSTEVLNNLPLTQGDRNSHSFHVSFNEEVELAGYQLLVFYKLPESAQLEKPIVDKYDLTDGNRNLDIIIPSKALQKTGNLIVEFALKHKTTDSYLTINESLKLEVFGTVNGAYLEALPGEQLQLSIDKQIEKLEYLLEVADGITNDFNENATDKTKLFNSNYEEKIKAFDKNASDSAADFNNFVSKKVEDAYTNLDKMAVQSATKASEEANVKVKSQEGKSIKEVQDATKTATEKAIIDVNDAKIAAVTKGQKEIDNYVDTTTKGNINTYVEETSKVEIDNYVDTTVKVDLNNHVETVSKKEIDNYVIEKESEIKGATFTPAVSSNGDLSFTNDKNLPNPEVVNIMGPVGPVGPKPVKGVDYLTIEEKENFTTETLKLVTTEGSNQMSLINQKGKEQVTAVKNQGTTSLVAVQKVQSEVERILNGQGAEGNALSLNGKTGVQYDKEIQGAVGGYDGSFPLSSARANGIYLVPQTGKFYKCKTAYNGGQISAPNSNFEDLSVLENRNRLDNLSENIGKFQEKTLIKNEDLNNIISEGMYYSTWNNTCLNTPDPNYKAEFLLKVFEIIKGGSYKIQIFICCSVNCDVYIRGWNYAQNKYGPWKKFNLADISI